MDKFCEKVAEILEVDKIGANDNFRDASEFWDSMMGFSMIVMMDNDYNFNMPVNDFLQCNTVKDLWERIKKG